MKNKNFCFRNRMLEKDGSEEFVEDIVDDLITVTLDKCYELYIDRQLLPFTVTQAKDAILSIIEVLMKFCFIILECL